MKTVVPAILIAAVAILLFANVWNAYTIHETRAATEEDRRRYLYVADANRELVATVAVLRSSARLRMLAEESLNLKVATEDRVIYLEAGAARDIDSDASAAIAGGSGRR